MSKLKNIFSIAATSAIATLSMTITASALTRISGDGISLYGGEPSHTGNGYWYGVESPSDVSIFGWGYNNSEYADLKIERGTTAHTIGKNGYEGNYKCVSVTVFNNTTNRYAYNQGNETKLTATAANPGNINSATYMGEIYGGTGSNSNFLDGYIIEAHNKE